MPKPALPTVIAFVVGLGFGFLAWGEPSRRQEAEFVQNLGAVLGDVREQNRLMQQILAEGERRARSSLAVCEKAQVKLQTDLAQCLFAKAGELPAAGEDPDDGRPRTGLTPFTETFEYPVPIPPPAAAPPQ
jgi:hypothetical protein